jgi:hypothetical protein
VPNQAEIVTVRVSQQMRERRPGTMLRLKPRQRELLLEKWPDLANLAMGGLLFGQFLGDEPVSIPVGLVGLAIWIAVMALTLVLAGEKE